MLVPEVQIFTPYGATESPPRRLDRQRRNPGRDPPATDRGAGVCVGRPVPGMRVAIIRICDEPIAVWSDDLRSPTGEIGEIVVSGPVVTREYFHRPRPPPWPRSPIPARSDGFWHRMGDLGYRDDRGRIWFCGRKSHRVVTATGTLFTIPCEAVFNTHPAVFRTALVGVGQRGAARPILCVELEREHRRSPKSQLVSEFLELGAKFEHTRGITTILFHPAFPVDIRHNAKIFREKLAIWAARKLR